MREKEIQWLRDHQDQVERLQGKWIADVVFVGF